MRQHVVELLPWLLSAVTCWQMWLAGDMRASAWLLGLVCQLGWVVWIVASETWGFVPLNVALWITYWRNYRKWRHR